jgi:uncharacterized membrane protein (UPF0127 family)
MIKMAIATKVYFVDKNDEVQQVVEIAPSKRAITKKYETEGLEVLKQVDVTKDYTFTIEDVLKGNINENQAKMLTYVLQEVGVPYDNSNNNTEKED